MGGEWTALAATCRWEWPETTVIDAAAVAIRTEARIIDPRRLDPARTHSASLFAAGIGISLTPMPDQLAEWVESVADAMLADGTDMERWATFYDELSDLFREGEALAGKRILLTAEGRLAPCNEKAETEPGGSGRRRRRRSAFFSPRGATDREAAEDFSDDSLQSGTTTDDDPDVASQIQPPRSMEAWIVFMHPNLSWYDGPNRRAGRAFLENERLVQPFRTERLLGLLGRVIQSTTADRVQRDALEFAFRLFANQPDRHARELAAVGLRVPNQRGEWIDAASALFGDPWPVAGAADLSALAAAASEQTPELLQLRSLLIAEPAAFPSESSVPDTAKWTDFLKILLVIEGLPVLESSDPRSIQGRHLVARTIAGEKAPERIPRGVVEQWVEGVQTTGNRNHPETKFQSGDLWYWFLGQHEVRLLPAGLRSRYARMVVRTLPKLERKHWESIWRRQSPGGFETRVPTPLASFVRHQRWVPTMGPHQTTLEFGPPNACWVVGPEDQLATTYSPLVEPGLRRMIESLPAATRRPGRLEVLTWGAAEYAVELVAHLSELFAAGEIPESSAEHFRSGLSRAWAQVGDPQVRDAPQLQEGLLVDRAGRLELLDRENAGEERVFVAGVADQSTTTRLVRELGWPVVSVDSHDVSRMREVAKAVLIPHWHEDVEVATDWKVEVLADGEAWLPSQADQGLCAELPWLPLVVACTMLFPRTPGLRIGRQLERILDEFSRIRLVRCADISVLTPRGTEALPRRLRGVLPLPGEQPTLLVEKLGTPLTWDQLGTVTEAALELVDQKRFTAELSLSIGRLAPAGNADVDPPETADIAEALGIQAVHVEETRTRVYGAAAGLVARVRPAAVCLFGDVALDALDDDVVQTREDLNDGLTRLFAGDAARAGELVEAATHARDADALRRELSIPLSQYNDVLARYFPGAHLIDNTAEQREEFDLRRSQRRGELINWARERRYPKFEAGEDQPDWAQIRELGFLTPDAGWGSTLDELDPTVVDGRIDEQMEQAFGPRPLSPVLEDWTRIRDANGRHLRERLVDIARLINAWKRGQQTGTASAGAVVAPGDEFAETARSALERVGALEFVVLDGEMLVTWLRHVDLWPSEMPRSTALDDLGLSETDLASLVTEQQAVRDAKLRADRQIEVHGEVVDLDLRMTAFVEKIEANLKAAPTSLGTPYRVTNLQVLAETGRDRKRSSGGGLMSGPPARLSDTQRQAIGLAGELTAFYWLQAKDRSPVDETCWKSTNVALAFEGALGDDSLGYDFEVARRHGSVMYEVKATTGDAGTIELGESEVACAQEYARNDRWRLLIVEDVLSLQPRVLMLPNPFRRDSRAKFRFVGNGVRLRFKL
ncbi:protein NO VEIN domain-containing protein [Kribbella sp. DT2]|uniref:protein NO VEIN domain-containing protein n=1 Tax=Kribbella sp. DT2 TaxID=3393427 RepID=UPI003CF9FEA4